MAATFNFCEDNGALSSGHGTVRSGFGADTYYATDVNWKAADDCTANSGTAYSAAPITAGNNSFTKYQFGKFSGSFNQISAGKFSANTTNAGAAGSALATGLTLKGIVSSTYATPSATTNASLTTDYTAGGPAVGSGATVLFSTTGPEGGSPTSTLSTTGYTQYLATQLQTTSSAAAGDTASLYIALQYSEN